MTDRYVTRADQVIRDPTDGTEILMATTVFEAAAEQNTGLLSPVGLPLYRVRETVLIGFRGRKMKS
jgi:hypothetical protein